MVVLVLFSCSKSGDNTPATPPTLNFGTAGISEGNSGTKAMEFTLTLSQASKTQSSVKVATADGTAKVGDDYKAFTGTVTFNPGETSKKVIVEIVSDEFKEADEDFSLRLSDPVNCTLSGTTIFATIINDDTRIPVTDAGYRTPNTYPGMNLVWADEFDGPTVSLASWNFEFGDGCPSLCGWGNNELEFYTQENALIQDGKLVIEARRENRGSRSFTSARMTTRNKRFFKFGRIDIRARSPFGRGIWPALWMLPQEEKFGGWPRSGEIDIMEIIGQEPNKVHATIHYGPGPGSIQISRSRTNPTPFSDQFHVYSLIWEEDRLRFLVDDVVYSDIRKADLGSNNYPFNETFYFIFNIAVGGNWPGSPDATTYFPQWMMVDYVRVFQ